MKNYRHLRIAAKQCRFPKAFLLPAFLFAFSASVQAQNCTINAGIDQTICANATMTLTGIKNGSFQTGVTTWTQVSGSAVTITSPNSLTTSVTGFIAGTYTFRLSTTCLDGSAINDDVVVTVSPIVIANAGPDQVLCPGSGTLAANSPSPGTGYWGLIGTNYGGITVTTSGSPTSAIILRADSAGATTLRYTITQGACTSFDDVIITNRGGVSPVNAGPDQVLSGCYSSTTYATLAGSFAGKGVSGQGGTWTTVSGPNTPSITTPTLLSSGVTNLIQGIYVFRWTASGACLSGYDDIQITVPAPSATLTASSAGAAQTFCDGRATVVLSGNATTYAGETVQWTQTAGPSGATISSPLSPSTTVAGLDGSSSYAFQYAITNTNSGCSSISTVTVDYNAAPSILVNGGVKTITLPCGTTTVSVPYTVGGGNTTQYRIISAPSGYALPNYWTTAASGSPQPFYGITIPGTYVMRFMRTGGTGCSAAYDEVNVVVSKTPSSSRAGTYQTLACNVVATSLAGNVPATGSGSWSQVSGPNAAVIANPSLNTSGISGLVNGKYIFKWIISAGSACPASEDTVSVVVASTTPTVANAGPDATVCNGSPITLSANNPVLNETGTWTVSPSTGISFSSVNSPVPTVTGLQANTAYTFTWTISNACGTTTDDVVITANNTTGPAQATAGPDQCLASGTTTTTLTGNASSPAGASSVWSQLSGPSAATIVSPAGSSSSITGMSNGSYFFVRTMSLGSCPNTKDTVIVTVSAAATTANAGSAQSICATTSTMAANNPTVGTGTWTQVSGPGGSTFVSPSQNNTAVTSLVPGIYTFRWTISNGGCASNFSDVAVHVSKAPSASDAGPDQSCLTGSSATLAAVAATSGTGLWNQISGPAPATITTASDAATTVTALANGVYTFRWTITGGPACTPTTDDVVVSVNQPASGGGTATLCNVSTSLLSGNANSNGAWTRISGPNTPTLTALSGYTASVENLITGTYVFRYTLTPATGCASTSVDRTLVLPASPSTAVAGANQSICNASSFAFNATAPATGTGTWTKVSGPANGTFSSTTAANAAYNSATTGLYTFQWTVANGGCSNAAQMTVNNAPLASAANAGANQSFCGASTTNLAATSPSTGTGSWAQVSGPTTTTIQNPALASTAISGLSTGVYTFRWTVSSGACAATTADMKIGVCSYLPLRLLSFTGKVEDGLPRLQWKTANEEGMKYFAVERSSNGNDFVSLARVAAKNASANGYSYDDNQNTRSAGSLYYRLKMVNADGGASYSDIVRLLLQKDSRLLIALAPNPVRTSATLQVESEKAEKVFVRISNSAGKTIMLQSKILVAGSNQLPLPTQGLSNGLYVVTVEASGETFSQKMLVQH